MRLFLHKACWALIWFLLPVAGSARFSMTVEVWVQCSSADESFPAFVTNKNWEEGEIIDQTSHSHYGKTRSSGKYHGWSIALAPNGSWSWNMGDGKNRLDYQPSSDRQLVSDGQLHQLAFSLNEREKVARLYFDGEQVALYSLEELTELNFNSALLGLIRKGEGPFKPVDLFVDATEQPASYFQQRWEEKTGLKKKDKPKQEDTTFKVLAWNIWHGGRRDGNFEGLNRTIRIIRESGAAIICMQETYGSGPQIADALGFVYYYRSTNLSVMSRFPIMETYGLYQPFRFGGVGLALPGNRQLAVFSLWIHWLPNTDVLIPAATTADTIILEENKTRGKEIREILAELREWQVGHPDLPVIVAGDFNSPSHLDWTVAMKSRNNGLVVEWPVSKAMAEAGFRDAYRTVHSDPATNYGRTWSPRFREAWQDRIDYIYFSTGQLECLDATVLDQAVPRWPSDHAAVLATFSWLE